MQLLSKEKVASFSVDSVLVRDVAKLRELKEKSGEPQ